MPLDRVDRTEIDALLRNTHLFGRLPQEDLDALEDQVNVIKLPAGELLYRQGQKAESFYVIVEGRVRVQAVKGRVVQTLGEYGPGDYFGEEGLLTHTPRHLTVTAATDATLLEIDHKTFDSLVKRYPSLIPSLHTSVNTMRLLRSVKLPWLNKGEVVYQIARRHTFFLWISILLPVIGVLIGLTIFAMLAIYFPDSGILLVGLGLWVLAMAGWAGWNVIDWSNDYYIITNQRVVWLERVLALYDSREEAPLSTILSVGIESSQLGRIIGYGDVVVRTYTGPLRFTRIGYPRDFANMVEDYWNRSKADVRREEREEMMHAIRRKLGVEPPLPPPVKKPPPKKRSAIVEPGSLSELLATLFNLRFATGNVITYRKHWYILLKAEAQPLIFSALGLAAIAAWALGPLSWIPSGTFWLVEILYQFGVFLWALYQYLDWRNDIYQVSEDQILDIEKRPLGDENKRTAPLDNILSIEYERLGLLGILLNFGTVKINIGASVFTFDYVYRPSDVQQELFRRMYERQVRKKQLELQAERERVSEWFATYHRSQNDLRRPPPYTPNV